MRSPSTAGCTALTVVALGLALSGCGSDASSSASSAASSSSTSATSSTQSASESAESNPSTSPAAPGAAAANETLADYLKDSGITQTPVHRGDPGTPTLDMPTPRGWTNGGPKTPPNAWGEIVFTGDPTAASDPPTILATMSKLTGNVDQAKIFQYAPGELKNLPGFEGMGDGQADKLGGFDAFQIGGTYLKDGAKKMIAQKTVVIPAKDGTGVFVLQLNASGTEDQMGPLLDATSQIDDKTVITP